VPASEVRWSATGGTLSKQFDSTNNSGQSSVLWTASNAPGSYTATATIDGVGEVTFSSLVTPSGGELVFRFLDAGSYHACGIATDEQLYCWGYNGDGQLGLAPGDSATVPTRVPDVRRYRLVSGGRYHSCGITLSGEGQCWGEDRDGRTNGPDGVVEVLSFQAIQSGLVHSCGLTLSREVWCWGYNGECELGLGFCPPGAYSDTSVYVGNRFRSVTVAGLHSCAIREGGAAACWGFNAEGQTGSNSGQRLDLIPTLVGGGIAFNTDSLIVPPSPDPDFPLPQGPFIAAGYAHTCAIAASGSSYCWGINQNGQLGDGTRAPQSLPVLVNSAVPFVRITAGYRHSCGLTSQGQAYCWGANDLGQLGDGSFTERLVPTPVSGGISFAYIKAGDLSTCGVSTTGVAYCWGDNEYGQLGNGTRTSSNAPVKVAFQP
jgi:alpha-tubulin suppressor-like RCC1 family protein